MDEETEAENGEVIQLVNGRATFKPRLSGPRVWPVIPPSSCPINIWVLKEIHTFRS